MKPSTAVVLPAETLNGNRGPARCGDPECTRPV